VPSYETKEPMSEFGDAVGRHAGPLGRAELPEVQTGPAQLETRGGPLTRFLFAVVFCLFWNGIVSVFVTIAVRRWLSGSPEWFLMLFLVPFVAIGLGMVGFAIHAGLATLNPKPVLEVSRRVVPTGESFDLSWHLTKRADRLRRLALNLELWEKATYRRGTNTHTEEKELLVIPIAELEGVDIGTRGSAEVTIPSDAMHSFAAPSNEFYWVIHAHGDISRWPDIDSKHELTVIPPDLPML
jgi:hypothetical protein